MKSLFDYDILVNDVFYRTQHILEYISLNPNMNDFEKEAISNTIMDALVYKGLIDPKKESLDLQKLCIRENLDYFTYQEKPIVAGVPLWLMEKYEERVCEFSAHSSAAFFLSKPAGNVSFCIYDMNTVSSIIFDDFSFILTSYDSPTRPGVRAEDRPFIQVELYGEQYIIDWLTTKRIFNVKAFTEKFNMVVSAKTEKSKLTLSERSRYKKGSAQITDIDSIVRELYFDSIFFADERFRDSAKPQYSYYFEKFANKYRKELEQKNYQIDNTSSLGLINSMKGMN